MKVDRLLKLADYLDKLPPVRKEGKNVVKYDQNTFGVVEYHGGIKSVNGRCVVDEGFCKTSACALGHAAMMPEFNRLGLRIDWKPDDDNTNRLIAYIRLNRETVGNDFTTEYDLAERFFGIDYYTADLLFGGQDDVTPKKKAKQIRKVVKDYQNELRQNKSETKGS